MSAIEQILLATEHRPFEMPNGKWAYYQEWNKALFLHWKVDYDSLRALVPKQMKIDLFHGDAYVSLVAFTMEKIRPRNLPAISLVSDFDEVNLRTYIDMDGRKGIYFLSVEAGKLLSAFVAKTLSAVPYERATTKRTNYTYTSFNPRRGFHLDTEFEVKDLITEKTELDSWLTERYCLYVEKDENVFRYDIHHKEWEIKQVKLTKLDIDYSMGELSLKHNPDLAHYSDGVPAVAWKIKKV